MYFAIKQKTKYKEINVFKDGMTTAKENKLNYLETAVECWDWYCKYEHYGILTNIMLFQFEDNLLRINSSVNLLFINFYLCLLAIIDVDSNLLKLENTKEIERFIFENLN